jgi:cation diffusion facilitator CzcD-associated flavoprotein CzcO
MRDWVIVGAGPVGCHLAISLLQSGQTGRDQIALLDDKEPLSLWKRRADSCGMSYLRSSCVHHIGISTAALSQFRKRLFPGLSERRGKVGSPSLRLFNSHCDHLCREFSLRELWRKDRVERISLASNGTYRVHSGHAVVEARRVVLALGPAWRPRIPSWLESARERISFLLDPGFQREQIPVGSRIAVLGGGMTAVQAALELSR